MRKIAIILMFLVTTGCAAAMPVEQQDMTYQKIIEMPRFSKVDIYEKSRQWVALRFKSAKAVVEYENKEEGVIIGNGSMPRPLSAVNIEGIGTISYSMKEDIKDGRARLTFQKFRALVPPHYNSVAGTMPGGDFSIRQGDLPEMRTNFDELAQDLQAYILKGKIEDKW